MGDNVTTRPKILTTEEQQIFVEKIKEYPYSLVYVHGTDDFDTIVKYFKLFKLKYAKNFLTFLRGSLTTAISKASQENILAYTQTMIQEIEREKEERDETERIRTEESQSRYAVVPRRAIDIPRNLGYSTPEMQRQAQREAREASRREHNTTVSARRDKQTGDDDSSIYRDRDNYGGARRSKSRRRKSRRRKSKRHKKTHRNKH